MTSQCYSDIRRCVDCSKYGKPYYNPYTAYCQYSAEKSKNWTGEGCWKPGTKTEPMVMCDPPIELKGCDQC